MINIGISCVLIPLGLWAVALASAAPSTNTVATRCFVERFGAIQRAREEEHVGFCVDEQPLFFDVTREQRRDGPIGAKAGSTQYTINVTLKALGQSPVRNAQVAVFIGDSALPTVMTTNDEGALPTIETDRPAKITGYLAWDQIYVHPESDDERSQDK